MTVSEIPTNIWNKVSFQLSDSNISKGWKITRNIAWGIFTIGSVLVNPAATPIALSAIATKWVGLITVIAGVIAGRAQADTSKTKK